LFIQRDERPDLIGNAVRESNDFYKNVIKHGKKEAIAMIVGASASPSGSGTTTMARLAGGGSVGGFGGLSAACCSGCNEDNKNDKTGKDGKEAGKDKDVGKEGKDSKDGADKGSSKDGIEKSSKLSPEKGSVDTSGILATYVQLGVQQFNRTDRDFPF